MYSKNSYLNTPIVLISLICTKARQESMARNAALMMKTNIRWPVTKQDCDRLLSNITVVQSTKKLMTTYTINLSSKAKQMHSLNQLWCKLQVKFLPTSCLNMSPDHMGEAFPWSKPQQKIQSVISHKPQTLVHIENMTFSVCNDLLETCLRRRSSTTINKPNGVTYKMDKYHDLAT